MRHKDTVVEAEIDAIVDCSPGTQPNAIAKATVETVREAIAALPAEFREIEVLRELEGLSYNV